MTLFRDNIPKRKIYVDDEPIEIAEDTSSADIILAAKHNPSTYSLAMQDARGGNQLVPASQRIKVRDGQRFETSINGIGG